MWLSIIQSDLPFLVMIYSIVLVTVSRVLETVCGKVETAFQKGYFVLNIFLSWVCKVMVESVLKGC